MTTYQLLPLFLHLPLPVKLHNTMQSCQSPSCEVWAMWPATLPMMSINPIGVQYSKIVTYTHVYTYLFEQQVHMYMEITHNHNSHILACAWCCQKPGYFAYLVFFYLHYVYEDLTLQLLVVIG